MAIKLTLNGNGKIVVGTPALNQRYSNGNVFSTPPMARVVVNVAFSKNGKKKELAKAPSSQHNNGNKCSDKVSI